MRLIDIVIKDLTMFLRDKKAIGIMILMPIILTTILGTALKSSFISDEYKGKINVAIVKEYNTIEETEKFINFMSNNILLSEVDEIDMASIIEAAENMNIDKIFTENFLENEEIKKILEYELVDREKAFALLEDRQVSAVIVLPEDFVYDGYINFIMPFRNKMSMEVIGHPESYIGSQIAEAIMQGFSDSLSTIIIGKNVFLETAMEENIGLNVFKDMRDFIEELTDSMENLRADITSRNIDGETPISGFQYYTVGMIGMFILFAAGNGGKLLLEEKDNLTFQRMISAGVSKGKIALGKFFTIFTFALIQILVMIAYSSLALGVSWGNPILVALTSICTVFAVAGLGMIVAALTFKSNNYKASDLFQSLIINLMAVLGGSFIPINIFPDAIQKLSNLTLNGIAIKVYLWIMTGNGLEKILPYLLGLIGMGILFIAIAIIILKDMGRWSYAKYNKTKTHGLEG